MQTCHKHVKIEEALSFTIQLTNVLTQLYSTNTKASHIHTADNVLVYEMFSLQWTHTQSVE